MVLARLGSCAEGPCPVLCVGCVSAEHGPSERELSFGPGHMAQRSTTLRSRSLLERATVRLS